MSKGSVVAQGAVVNSAEGLADIEEHVMVRHGPLRDGGNRSLCGYLEKRNEHVQTHETSSAAGRHRAAGSPAPGGLRAGQRADQDRLGPIQVGGFSTMGADVARGIGFAVDEANAKGGVDGRRIILAE